MSKSLQFSSSRSVRIYYMSLKTSACSIRQLRETLLDMDTIWGERVKPLKSGWNILYALGNVIWRFRLFAVSKRQVRRWCSFRWLIQFAIKYFCNVCNIWLISIPWFPRCNETADGNPHSVQKWCHGEKSMHQNCPRNRSAYSASTDTGKTLLYLSMMTIGISHWSRKKIGISHRWRKDNWHFACLCEVSILSHIFYG